MQHIIARFVHEDEGQDLIEYALLATLIALVCGLGASALGTNLNDWYQKMADKVTTWTAKAA
jgi:Flp pilus assembly pilin Flp